jgi:hypothetical protein
MNPDFDDARAALEADGLTVKPCGEAGLWICDTIEEAGGIRLSHDASMLQRENGRWVAIFPAAGMLSYEVPGDLRDLVLLIRDVYANYRRSGGAFKDAFARSVPDPEPYLVDRPSAEDRPAAVSLSK